MLMSIFEKLPYLYPMHVVEILFSSLVLRSIELLFYSREKTQPPLKNEEYSHNRPNVSGERNEVQRGATRCRRSRGLVDCRTSDFTVEVYIYSR